MFGILNEFKISPKILNIIMYAKIYAKVLKESIIAPFKMSNFDDFSYLFLTFIFKFKLFSCIIYLFLNRKL